MKLAIREISKITKQSIINSMLDWPFLAIAPETKDQERVLAEANQTYTVLSLWLAYRLLSRSDLHFLLLSEPYLSLKPRADLAVAGLDFCFQVFARHRSHFSSAEELWSVCEHSLAKNEMRNTGYYGDKIEGKNASYEVTKKALNNFKVFAEGGQIERNKECDPSEHYYEQLLDWAFFYARENADKDLEHHAHRFLQAWRHYNDIMRRNGAELIKAKPEKKKRDRSKKQNVTKR